MAIFSGAVGGALIGSVIGYFVNTELARRRVDAERETLLRQRRSDKYRQRALHLKNIIAALSDLEVMLPPLRATGKRLREAEDEFKNEKNREDQEFVFNTRVKPRLDAYEAHKERASVHLQKVLNEAEKYGHILGVREIHPLLPRYLRFFLYRLILPSTEPDCSPEVVTTVALHFDALMTDLLMLVQVEETTADEMLVQPKQFGRASVPYLTLMNENFPKRDRPRMEDLDFSWLSRNDPS